MGLGRRARRTTVSALLVIALIVLSACSSGPTKVPWQDPSAKGAITFYDQAGKVLTKGSVTTHPFVWKAVGSTPAGAGFTGAGKFATLLAYQPRQGADPTEWSGDLMSASTPYQDAAYPTVLMTATDFSLGDFLKEFPPKWKGMIQLRLFIGASGVPIQTNPYDTATVKVNGNKWMLVGG
jgi:hypothetical protein